MHEWTCEKRALGSCWAPLLKRPACGGGRGPLGGDGDSVRQRTHGDGRSQAPRALPLGVAPAPPPPKRPSAAGLGAQGPTQGCGRSHGRAGRGGKEARQLGRDRAASERRAGFGKTLKTEGLQLPERRGRVCGTAAGRGPGFQQP